ncbi:MAG: phosphonate ABC transporter ATP-binding protein [Phycisphaera sp.]|nr:phosphonate ABC transporter ATP-binding protein [Phycisphaera sp.]
MEGIVEIDQVTVRFPCGTTALNSASLTVPRHRIVVLLGHSGAGKSTMLRCMNGLQRPTSGRVIADGVGELTGRKRLREHRRRTGMIFQLHHLIGRQTALRNVLMGRLGYHPTWRTLLPLPRADVELAMDCLSRVGLADKALQRADQLSGGERQRVGIARALAQQPRLLLADEPVASLDPATANGVMELLSRICREDGLTAVISLHQLDLAHRFADQLVGLSCGGVVYDGPPRDLVEDDLSVIFRSIRKNPHREPASVAV